MRKKNKRSKRPIWLIIAGIFLIFSAALFIFLLPEQPSNEEPTPPPQAGPFPEITRVSLEEAKTAYDAGEAVFVDVRDRIYYDMGHIRGASSIPLAELPVRMGELDPQDWIITY